MGENIAGEPKQCSRGLIASAIAAKRLSRVKISTACIQWVKNILSKPETVMEEVGAEEEEFQEDTEVQEEGEEETVQETVQELIPEKVVVKVKTEKPVTPIQLKPTNTQQSALQTVLNLMNALHYEDVTIHYNGNVNIRQMDPSRVCLVEASIDFGNGLDLAAPKENIRDITTNIQYLRNALKIYTPTIDVQQNKAVFSDSKVKVSVPLFDDNIETIPEIKLNLNINSKIDFGDALVELKKLVKEPDALMLVSENGSLIIKGKNSEEQEIELQGWKADGGDGKTMFATSLLRALGKDQWQISFANDLPMKATLILTDTHYVDTKPITTKTATIVVYLAPRIETDA